MKVDSMRVFEYHSIEETLRLLDSRGEDVRPVGGGVAIGLLIKNGFFGDSDLVRLPAEMIDRDTARLDDGDRLVINAASTLTDISRNKIVRLHTPILARVIESVANFRVRNVATLGGNLAEADYASDLPTLLQALDANVHIRNIRRERTVSLAEFVRGPYETCLEVDELVTAVSVPSQRFGKTAEFLRFSSRTSGDRPCLVVGTSFHFAEGRIVDAEVVLGAGTATPFSNRDATAALIGLSSDELDLEGFSMRFLENVEMLTDSRGSADYRRNVATNLVQRVCETALSRA